MFVALSKSLEEFPGIGAGEAGEDGRLRGDKTVQVVVRAIDAHYRVWYVEEFCQCPA